MELPTFLLEEHFERWEFIARHNLTASDAETLTVGELLGLGGEPAREEFERLALGYLPARGTDDLRAAVAATYDHIEPGDVLCFAGAEEALFWTLECLLGPGDHAVVNVPNYQASESVPLATGAEVTGLPLWSGSGAATRWCLDLDRLRSLLRPNTTVVVVNFPNNPTGFVPDRDTFAELVALCDERGIRLLSDEVYRGIELDQASRLPQAADLSPRALSLNVMSKAYGLPGLRVGWLACRDRALLERLLQRKYYTSICNAGPSELLATVALRNAERVLERNRAIVAANRVVFDDFFARFAEWFDWTPPDGGCVAFPRYNGDVERFCTDLVQAHGVLLLPASIYRSRLAEVPPDRFRIGIGRRDPKPALEQITEYLRSG
jgi:aspartate/methionine/tyrosine aminotransferase